MQSHPYAQLAHRLHKLGHTRFDRSTAPETRAIFYVYAIGTGVLRDYQQFFHACVHQILRFLHNVTHRTAH